VRKAEFGFAGTPLREQLVAVVLRGDKTATAGLLVDYERDGEPLPTAGERYAVVDNEGRDVAVIEITEVNVCRIGDTDEQFARDEGEGFESVAVGVRRTTTTGEATPTRFGSDLGDPDWDVSDDTLYVAERFRLVELLEKP
jgi:uncharacterized protein YhfF